MGNTEGYFKQFSEYQKWLHQFALDSGAFANSYNLLQPMPFFMPQYFGGNLAFLHPQVQFGSFGLPNFCSPSYSSAPFAALHGGEANKGQKCSVPKAKVQPNPKKETCKTKKEMA